LLREPEGNKKAMRAARKRFNPPSPELSFTYRGLFGPIVVDVDPHWILNSRVASNFSPRSRRGRKLRRLLCIHEAHYARVSAKAALDWRGRSIADVAYRLRRCSL
jgi:hypothetical protein